MLKTRFTELVGIKHPIMLAGMNWITESKLVAAVSNAGGLGLLATARFGSKEEIRKNIKEIRELTDKPFGVNQGLIGPGAKEGIEVAIEEKVPVINYTLGKPWFIDQVHEYGGKVIGTVAISKHAYKAAQLGCDALSLTGHEAAAHGAGVTSLVLVPVVTAEVKIPVIAAGGFYNGRGLAAALALGAEGVSMGTRFGLTKESIVNDNFKQLCLKATPEDTLYSWVFDGMDARVLKNKAADEMMKGHFSLIEAMQGALEVKKLLNLSMAQFIGLSIQMMRPDEEGEVHSLWQQARQAIFNRRALKAIYEGDTDKGLYYVGQDVGGIRDIPTVQEAIDNIIAEAEKTLTSMGQKVVR